MEGEIRVKSIRDNCSLDNIVKMVKIPRAELLEVQDEVSL